MRDTRAHAEPHVRTNIYRTWGYELSCLFTIVQPSDRDRSQLCRSQIAVSVALSQSLSPRPPLVARPHPDDEAGHDAT